jgi:hypothetical protein
MVDIFEAEHRVAGLSQQLQDSLSQCSVFLVKLKENDNRNKMIAERKCTTNRI